jgi:hypothetical protein
VERVDLIVLVLDKNSQMLDVSSSEFEKVKEQYALNNATLVVVFLGEFANRIIAGQQIGDIDELPHFNDSEGRLDAALSIQRWIYEAQANMYSGSSVKIRTAIIVDAADDMIEAHNINPASILGSLNETEYFQIDRHSEVNAYERITVSPIAKLEALANAGDEKAMYELALAYAAGDGVEVNEPQAQILLHRAYLRGNIDAIYALVDLFDNPTEHFYKEAARHGHPKAAAMLEIKKKEQGE